MNHSYQKALPPEFTHLIYSRLLLSIAAQIQAVALGWQMYVLTKNALFLGLIGLAEAVPAISLALYSGYLVDRKDPVALFRIMIFISLISAAVMLTSQLEFAGIGPQLQIAALFFSSFLTGVARSFAQPSMYAIIPRIVPRNLLPTSSAWMAASFQISRVVGPGAGGVLFALLGVRITAAIACGLLLLSMILSPRFKLAPQAAARAGSLWDNLISGARFVFGHPILLPALSLDMISVFFGGVTALLPIYAAEILHIGPTGLGALRAAPFAGAAIVSILLTRIDLKKRAGRHLLLSVVGFGLSILVFAVSRNVVLSLIALALTGAFDSVSVVVRSSAVQFSSPDHMRGRISAVNSIFIGSSNELGEFESGLLAHYLGPVSASVIGGVICLATVAWAAAAFPKLRALDLNELEAAGPK